MDKDFREGFSDLCSHLFTKDGSPVCIFRVADEQPCGFLRERMCYYRGGPFSPRDPQDGLRPAKKTE